MHDVSVVETDVDLCDALFEGEDDEKDAVEVSGKGRIGRHPGPYNI